MRHGAIFHCSFGGLTFQIAGRCSIAQAGTACSHHVHGAFISNSRRVYEYAINQFIAWYCSEPRLALNRIVVVRYRMHLESRGLAANTINQQLAAVRRLAHEAADSGLLSPELAAGISRVKGVKQLGFRSGNSFPRHLPRETFVPIRK